MEDDAPKSAELRRAYAVQTWGGSQEVEDDPVDMKLRDLASAFDKRLEVDDEEERLVATARAVGVLWREIAAALDITVGHVKRMYATRVKAYVDVVDTTGLAPERVLQSLRRLPKRRRDRELELTVAVVDAWNAGATLREIGGVINMKSPNVAAKYGPIVRGEIPASETVGRRPKLLRSQRRG